MVRYDSIWARYRKARYGWCVRRSTPVPTSPSQCGISILPFLVRVWGCDQCCSSVFYSFSSGARLSLTFVIVFVFLRIFWGFVFVFPCFNSFCVRACLSVCLLCVSVLFVGCFSVGCWLVGWLIGLVFIGCSNVCLFSSLYFVV